MASSVTARSSSGLTPHLIATVAFICLGSLQFGYHMAELNSPELIISCRRSVPGGIPFKQSWFGQHGFVKCIPLAPEQVGLVTSIFSIGGLIGSLYIGAVADSIGRKKASLLHCVFFFFGSTINGLSNDYFALLFGRFVCGLGAGAAIVITSLLINEISPANSKGLLGSMNQFSINIGILFTQLLSLKWSTDNSWRLLLFMGSIISVVNFLFVILYVEESPVWLLHNGHSTKAFTVLHRLRGGSYSDSTNEVNSWKHDATDGSDGLLNESVSEDGESSSNGGTPKSRAVTLREYLTSSEYNNSKIVATGILIFQQFDGINSIIFYGVSVLISIFPNHAIAINCLISVVNVVVTFVSATIVDKLGRKPLLLISVSFLGVSSTLMGIGITYSNSLISIIGTFTYITFFAVGLGPIPFLIVGEVTQAKAKGSAQSWGTTMNWLATFIVGFAFPILKNSWIGGGVYFIFTFMCFLSYLFVKYYIPETKGLHSYEEVWSTENTDN
ncbi:general substrate transporter [Scheffersomyces coipomensis]|uniref:general substrate transporter n=1 Tax=Scheffersomyces coipomensis TaxID=1788519 RepID=UPI00315D0623